MHALLLVGAACAALVAILAVARTLYKVMRAAVRAEEALPILFEIAEQFRPNGGGSLRDQVDGIRREQASVRFDMKRRVGRLEAEAKTRGWEIDA